MLADYSTDLKLHEPPHEQRMPQHPARHHAPAHQLGPIAYEQGKRLIASDSDGLAYPNQLPIPTRMLVGDFEHDRQAQSPHTIGSDDPPVTMTSSVTLGFTLSHAGDWIPGR